MGTRVGVWPPLDAPLMATLPGPAYLLLTRNSLWKKKARREPARSWELMNSEHTRRQWNRRKSFPIWRAPDRTSNIRASCTDLGFSSSAPVPFITEFTSTPNVRNSEDCAVHLQKSENHWTVERIHRHAKSTITCAEKRGWRFPLDSSWWTTYRIGSPPPFHQISSICDEQ